MTMRDLPARDNPSAPRVVITGATGFVGRYLVMRLLRAGMHITALVRDIEKAKAVLGRQAIELVKLDDEANLQKALDGCKALIHLAGAPVFKRWTPAHKQAMWDSRIKLAKNLARLATSPERRPPEVIIGASGIGIYGDGHDQLLQEDSPPGEDYLAKLAVAWEEAWDEARAHGIRVVNLRIGIVLGIEGGFLEKILPVADMGIVARTGSGKQFVAWVHLQDIARMIEWAIENRSAQGPYNACAPSPQRHDDLMREIGERSQARLSLRAPQWLLSTLLGELGTMMGSGQRALPQRALNEGFQFRYPELPAALDEILASSKVSFLENTGALPETDYLNKGSANRELIQENTLDAPLEEIFEFFSQAENLGALTPSGMSFQIQTPAPIDMQSGTLIDYRIKVGLLRFPWRTRIDIWQPQESFVDVQLRGPYHRWHHLHHFQSVNATQTAMRDHVHYRVGPPIPGLNFLFNWVERRIVRPQLRRIFSYRETMIQARFGAREQEKVSA